MKPDLVSLAKEADRIGCPDLSRLATELLEWQSYAWVDRAKVADMAFFLDARIRRRTAAHDREAVIIENSKRGTQALASL